MAKYIHFVLGKFLIWKQLPYTYLPDRASASTVVVSECFGNLDRMWRLVQNHYEPEYKELNWGGAKGHKFKIGRFADNAVLDRLKCL